VSVSLVTSLVGWSTELRAPIQFIRYLVVGGIAASMNVASRVLYNVWTGYSMAIVLAHLTGMTVTFLLARKYVFREGQRDSAVTSIVPFFIVQGVALLESWAISVFLAEHALPRLGVRHFGHEIAHATGVATAVLTNYFGNKHWAFRLTSATDGSARMT
jgi:putative flippase GtrA